MVAVTVLGPSAFTRDVLGRYVCNTLDEAVRSTDPTVMRGDGRPQIEARHFDLIVIGGGTFGLVIAEHLAFRDRARSHRILVLEGGPMLVSEHVQNMPMLGLDTPAPTSIAELEPDPAKRAQISARAEVWGLSWHSSIPFPGLAYCLGGRSLYWGGWSPEPLETELPNGTWPQPVVADLTANALADGSAGYFRQASEQIGTAETNDFIFGDLHTALRAQLLGGLGTVTDAVPIATLPDHPAVRYAGGVVTSQTLAALLGLDPTQPLPSDNAMRDALKLDAPLAVQGRNGHAGFFPFSKFSAVPLAIKSVREAFAEAGTDDARRRLMIVPNCHVIRVTTAPDGNDVRVTEVVTNQGSVKVADGGAVIVALGTIESARLLKDSLEGQLPGPAWARIGTNLVAHLRSNLNVRVPRTVFANLPAAAQALQASATFVKGRHTFPDGTVGHFHLQVTASGLGAIGGNSEAELFKTIPDIDTYNVHKNANDTHVSITIRGIGEMQPHNPESRVLLDQEVDEWGIRRALVQIADPRDPTVRARNGHSVKDHELWQAMDQASQDVAKLFGVANPPAPTRDGLGTTHHESGTLYMGDDGSTSVTMPDCRLRHTSNVFVTGPAVYPSSGSPNPMLTGVALARRTADQLASPQPWQPDAGFTPLFNGYDTSQWRMTTIRNQPGRDNPGRMRVIDGTLETVAGTDLGVFWCTKATPSDFVLKLEWLRLSEESNSGVYVRFPDPDSKGYNNTAFVADDFGFEVQIDERGDMPVHRTGAVYRKDNRDDNEVLSLKPARPVGPASWNQYQIEVLGQQYTVKLNGEVVCQFDNTNLYANRGRPGTANAPTYLGLQVYSNPRHFVRFRRVQIKAL